MPTVCYVPKKFNAEHTELIAIADSICAHYANNGMVLTLRQLYYQFVAHHNYANHQANYNKLGNVLRDARLAGELDWDYLIDRTRNEIRKPNWKNPGELLEQAASSYHTDLWKGQGVRPIIMVEKDAAIGVIEGVCADNDIPYLACRGYMSASEMWSAAQRIRFDIELGDRVVLLHIGDHDPSGIDMTRDIADRLSMFLYKDWSLLQGKYLLRPVTRGHIKQHMRDYMREQGGNISDAQSPLEVRRIALNMDQVQTYEPPPNFAKPSDTRYETYVAETGTTDCWELDALDPDVLVDLIQTEIDRVRDESKWDVAIENQERERIVLNGISKHFTPVVDLVKVLEATNE